MEKVDSYIDDSIIIDFEIPPVIQEFIKAIEEADKTKDDGLFLNNTDYIENSTKNYVIDGILTMEQRERLIKKYCVRWWNS